MMFRGRCAYCGHELPPKGWHADHIKAIVCKVRYVYDDKKGYYIAKQTGKCWAPENDRTDNLFPSCRACNIDKGPCDLESWRRSLEDRANVCRRNHAAFRHAERFGRVVVVDGPIVFWFEKMAKSEALLGLVMGPR